MLRLDRPIDVEGYTLFPDHIVAGLHHLVPGPPLVVSGPDRLGVSLLRYRGGAAGGLLTLEVELGPDGDARDRIRSALQDRVGPGGEVVPVLFSEGTVRLCGLGVGGPTTAGTAPTGEDTGEGGVAAAGRPAIVEQVLGTGIPSLLGRQRAMFSVRLTPEGTTLVAGALEGGQTQLLVVYELALSGLVPARGLRAQVRTARAYEHLRTRIAGGTLLFRADLDREADALELDGLIHIEDVDYTGSDPAVLAQRQQEAVRTLHDLTETLFFRPAASPLALGAEALEADGGLRAAWQERGATRAAFVLRSLDQAEQQELTYDFGTSTVGTRRIAPQGPLRLPPGVEVAAILHDVDLDWPPPVTEVSVVADPGADWTGVAAVHVDVRVGDEGRSVVVTPTQPRAHLTLPAGPVEHRVRPFLQVDPDALGDPPAPVEAFAPLETRTLFVAPERLSGRRMVRVALGIVDPEVVNQVAVTLLAGARRRELLVDHRTPEVVVPVLGSEPVRLEARLHLVDGGEVTVDQVIGPDDRIVVIHQPLGLVRTVLVELQDPLERYETVFVELEGPGGGRRGQVTLTPSQPRSTWSHPASDAGPFRYRVRTVGRNAGTEQGPWRDGTGSLLVAGDVDVRLEAVEVFLLGVADSLGSLVRLRSLAPPAGVPATVERFLEPGQSRLAVRLPFAPEAARRYEVEGQVFFATGVVELGPRSEAGEVVIVPVPPPA